MTMYVIRSLLDIYVIPPTEAVETDEDLDDSDDEHEGNLNYIGRKMLPTTCEIQYHSEDNIAPSERVGKWSRS